MNIAVVYDEEGRDVDIIDVDESIVRDMKTYLHEFFDWMFDKNNKHRYWMKADDGTLLGCNYRADAFTEWLRDFGFDRNAAVVEECAGSTRDLPTIEF